MELLHELSVAPARRRGNLPGADWQHVRDRLDRRDRRAAAESRRRCISRSTAGAAACRVSSRSTSRTSRASHPSSTACSGLGCSSGFMGMGRSVLAGACTLALLVLPVVILTTREALRAVPPSLREGSYALGATKWQTVWHQVAAGGVPGHPHRPHPGALARDRRNGPADHDRGADIRAVPAVAASGRPSPCCPIQIFVLGLQAASGLRAERRGWHCGAPRAAAPHQRDRHRAARPITEAVGLIDR